MAENCPAVKVGESAPCRWVPVAANLADISWVPDLDRGGYQQYVDVIEVCPACRRYRVAEYAPVPRDEDGVHSIP